MTSTRNCPSSRALAFQPNEPMPESAPERFVAFDTANPGTTAQSNGGEPATIEPERLTVSPSGPTRTAKASPAESPASTSIVSVVLPTETPSASVTSTANRSAPAAAGRIGQ